MLELEKYIASNETEKCSKNIAQKLQTAQTHFISFVKQVENISIEKYEYQILQTNYKVEIHDLFCQNQDIISQYKRLIEKYLQRKYFIRKIWWEKELIIFLWVIVRYSVFYKIEYRDMTMSDWDFIATLLPLKTGQECQLKLLALEKVSIQKIPWSCSEDQMLRKIIGYFYNRRKTGTYKWADIAKDLHDSTKSTHFRSSKQCRERWNNYLNPRLKKGDWLNEEDCQLLQLAKLRGKRWAQISREMHGRNENSVKNRYNCLIKKTIKQKRVILIIKYFISSKNLNQEPSQDFRISSQERFIIDEILKQKKCFFEVFENYDSIKVSNNENYDLSQYVNQLQKPQKQIKTDENQSTNDVFEEIFEKAENESASKNLLYSFFSGEKQKYDFDVEKNEIIKSMDDQFWTENEYSRQENINYENFLPFNNFQITY